MIGITNWQAFLLCCIIWFLILLAFKGYTVIKKSKENRVTTKENLYITLRNTNDTHAHDNYPANMTLQQAKDGAIASFALQNRTIKDVVLIDDNKVKKTFLGKRRFKERAVVGNDELICPSEVPLSQTISGYVQNNPGAMLKIVLISKVNFTGEVTGSERLCTADSESLIIRNIDDIADPNQFNITPPMKDIVKAVQVGKPIIDIIVSDKNAPVPLTITVDGWAIKEQHLLRHLNKTVLVTLPADKNNLVFRAQYGGIMDYMVNNVDRTNDMCVSVNGKSMFKEWRNEILLGNDPDSMYQSSRIPMMQSLNDEKPVTLTFIPFIEYRLPHRGMGAINQNASREDIGRYWDEDTADYLCISEPSTTGSDLIKLIIAKNPNTGIEKDNMILVYSQTSTRLVKYRLDGDMPTAGYYPLMYVVDKNKFNTDGSSTQPGIGASLPPTNIPVNFLVPNPSRQMQPLQTITIDDPDHTALAILKDMAVNELIAILQTQFGISSDNIDSTSFLLVKNQDYDSPSAVIDGKDSLDQTVTNAQQDGLTSIGLKQNTTEVLVRAVLEGSSLTMRLGGSPILQQDYGLFTPMGTIKTEYIDIYNREAAEPIEDSEEWSLGIRTMLGATPTPIQNNDFLVSHEDNASNIVLYFTGFVPRS